MKLVTEAKEEAQRTQSMDPIAVRVEFIDEETAYKRFHTFEPLDRLDRYSRKRDGSSHVILIHSIDDVSAIADETSHQPSSDVPAKSFLEGCKADPDVIGVENITEKEFWDAPSNAI